MRIKAFVTRVCDWLFKPETGSTDCVMCGDNTGSIYEPLCEACRIQAGFVSLMSFTDDNPFDDWGIDP